VAKRISEVKLLPVLTVAPWDRADVVAIQALAQGRADEAQQKRALNWIIYKACDFDGISYRESERDTAFAEGKKFIVHQLNALLTIDHRNIKED
jgi:hypothetical protein